MVAEAQKPGLSARKYLPWLLATLCLGFCAWIAIKYTLLKLSVAYACGEVAIFEQVKASAEGGTDPTQLSGLLQYVIDYYPSGSRLQKGTQLDNIVELARSNTVATIVARLRTSTGRDLGRDPQKWLAAYPQHDH